MNDKIKQLTHTKTAIKKELISLNKLLDFYQECHNNAKIEGDYDIILLSASTISTICNNIKSLQESYKDICNELIEEYTLEIISIQNKEINLIDELNKLYHMKDDINRTIVLIRREVKQDV